MPGLFGLILLEPSTPELEAEADATFDAMSRLLHHGGSHRERFRQRQGLFRLGVVGVPSIAHRVLRSRRGEWSELWYGEVVDGRRVEDDPGELSSSGVEHLRMDPPRVFADDGLASGHRDASEALARLSGVFAGIRFHPSSGLYQLFTDPVGAIPVFTRRAGPFFLFAPEAKATFATRKDLLHGDVRSLAFFLACGFVPPGRTHVVGVDSLPPGALLSGRAAWGGPVVEPVVEQYWEFRFGGPTRRGSSGELLDALVSTIDTVTKSQLSPNERTGVLLSGGYDSRGLLGAALRAGAPVSTVTWGYDDTLPESDAVIARALAGAAGVSHRFEPIRTLVLPEHAARWAWMMDGAVDAVSNYPEGDHVFERLSEDFDVLIRGDECFGMKWPYGVPNDRVARACIGVYPFGWHSIMERIVTPSAYRVLETACNEAQARLAEPIRADDPVDRKDEYYFKVRFRSYLNPLNHFKMQAIAMRSPLLDRRVLELVAELPRRARRSKRLFKTAVTRTLAPYPVPFATRTSLVPWRRVAATHPTIGAFFRERILEPSPLHEWLDRSSLEAQLGEWLTAPEGVPHAADPVLVSPSEPSPRRRRIVHAGKRVAYDPLTPDFMRRRLLPSRNTRRSFDYAFRLLVLSCYVARLREEGIHLAWVPR